MASLTKRVSAGLTISLVLALAGCGGSTTSLLDTGSNGLPFGQAGRSTASLNTEFVGITFTGTAADAVYDLNGGSFTKTGGRTDNVQMTFRRRRHDPPSGARWSDG